jgi:hypothetical protein
MRRSWAKEAKAWESRSAEAEETFATLADRLDDTIKTLEDDRQALVRDQAERDAWLAQHPETVDRLASTEQCDLLSDLFDRIRPVPGREVGVAREPSGRTDMGPAIEHDLGIEIGF